MNLDIQSPDFTTRIEDLDPGESYLVYCRSGSRSATAAAALADAGFADVVDAGGLQSLIDAGVPTT